MPDIIQLLPDATANMIAAGEVVQRPASVVKELMENSVDAGASDITVLILGGGQQLIQVIDNGKGMTETDARMCWERHATSKIRKPDDLFSLQTFGFRGEAMASIAAVSQVTLKTRLADEALGTLIHIEASEVKQQEPVQCPAGTSISVKNLFFNIPARRNFLKSASVETRHIIEEFQRVAMSHPSVSFTLSINDTVQFKLSASDLLTRIAEVLEIKDKQDLLPVSEDAGFVSINGFVGSPTSAKRTRGDQYFFANGRFIREPYFHHALMSAYEGLIGSDQFPVYVLFLEVKPDRLDVNVHPSKTEVKFEDGKDIYAVLRSSIRKSLAGLAVQTEEDAPETYHPIFSGKPSDPLAQWPTEPRITINPDYNPFGASTRKPRELTHWEKLYDPYQEHAPISEIPDMPASSPTLPLEHADGEIRFFQFNQTYLVAEWKGILYIVNQHHAHERVLYDRMKAVHGQRKMPSQQLLFPRTLRFNKADTEVMLEVLEEINKLGFDISHFGQNDFIVNGIPPDMERSDIQKVVEKMLEHYLINQKELRLDVRESLIRSMARNASIDAGTTIRRPEAILLLQQLFQSSEPAFTPYGKQVFVKFASQSIEQLFNK
jgi:DNA mismatch repair protein MutL